MRPRRTTPRIDELARQGLVLPRAFTLAPYTRCTVPTVLTGISFLRHGVVGSSDILADEAVTVSALLGRGGYHTVGLSANPNHAKSVNVREVYDEVLRVPVILRLPDDLHPPHDVTRGLVSVADIAPPLLALAGIEAGAGLDGRNVLDPPEPVGVSSTRALVSRDCGVEPALGVRTKRWKAVFKRGRHA